MVTTTDMMAMFELLRMKVLAEARREPEKLSAFERAHAFAFSRRIAPLYYRSAAGGDDPFVACYRVSYEQVKDLAEAIMRGEGLGRKLEDAAGILGLNNFSDAALVADVVRYLYLATSAEASQPLPEPERSVAELTHRALDAVLDVTGEIARVVKAAVAFSDIRL